MAVLPVVSDATGEAPGVFGMADALPAWAAAKSSTIAAASSDIVYQTNRSGDIVWISSAVTDVLGWSPHELTGRPAMDLLHPSDRADALTRRASLYGASGIASPTTYEDAARVRLRNRDGHYRWFRTRVRPALDSNLNVVGVIVSARDADDEYRAHRSYETLTAANRALVRAESEAELLQRTCEIVVGEGEFTAAWYGRPMDRLHSSMHVLAFAPDLGDTMPRHHGWRFPVQDQTLRKVLDQAVPLLDLELPKPTERWTRVVESMNAQSRFILPVLFEQKLDGILCVYGAEAEEFDEVALTMLRHLADDLGYGLTRLREHVQLTEAWSNSVDLLAATVEYRDPYTAGHQAHVAAVAEKLALELGCDHDEAMGIRLAAHVHDIGKVAIPLEVLNSLEPLTEDQVRLLQSHADVGWQIASRYRWPWPIAQIVRQHHERLDGSGYPLGLRGDEILLQARIVAVADVYDAIRNRRAYRPAQGRDRAVEILMADRGTLFDAAVVDALLRLLESGFDIVDRE